MYPPPIFSPFYHTLLCVMNNDYQIKASHQYISQKKYADAWYRYNVGIVCTYITYTWVVLTDLCIYLLRKSFSFEGF